ncbi:MAG: hypothetical protein QXL94_08210 [Candidatus Parvarchaeum sp.]
MDKQEFMKRFSERTNQDHVILRVKTSKVNIYADVYRFSKDDKYVIFTVDGEAIAKIKLSEISLVE